MATVAALQEILLNKSTRLEDIELIISTKPILDPNMYLENMTVLRKRDSKSVIVDYISKTLSPEIRLSY